MKRATGLKGLVLTLNNANVNITDAEAKKLCKRLLVALRDMADRKEWSYIIWVYFSRWEQEPDPEIAKWVKHIRQVKSPHFHVILYANPCSTIVDWIENYWNAPKKSKRQRVGIVTKHNIYNLSGFTGYCNRQKAFKERKQGYEGRTSLEMGKIYEYEQTEKTL